MKNRKHFVRNWLILIIILLGLGFFGWRSYMVSQVDPVDSNKTTVQAFVITKGQATKDIIKNLEEKGLIRSGFAFTQLLKERGLDGKIQAGDYKLSPSMSANEIINAFQAGAEDRWVTLIEGWRNEEMAAKLNAELGIEPKAFLKNAKEGHMFPDTYLINKDASPETVASLLKNTFNQRYSSELQAKIKAQGLTVEEGIIMASLLEREGRSLEVKKSIAGILLRRLKIGMGLNVDATVQYALGYQADEKSWWKKRLTYDDLKINSPYNTYIHAGLPPAAICNPGLVSLQAVAEASANTPYLYYFHDTQGNTYYAATLDEHNQNVANHR